MIEGIKMAVGGFGYFSTLGRTGMLDKVLDLHVQTFRCWRRRRFPSMSLRTLSAFSRGFLWTMTLPADIRASFRT